MKRFEWSKEKNNKLKRQRKIGFEDILVAIHEKRVLDRGDHPNQNRYLGQKIIIVEIDNYAYVIPIVEDEEKIFFKTIIPSRRMTKKYLRKEG